ncbi:MAG: GTPase Era [Pseudomonadota bacterium]
MPTDNLDTVNSSTRCGFVALLGPPNSGKSTLMNRLVGNKVSIVTHKVQTTRNRVRGIMTKGPCQIIFVDTPGIFDPSKRLERAMVAAAWSGAEEADQLVVLFDAQKARISGDMELIVEGLRSSKRKAILVLNKIDQVSRPKLLEMTTALSAQGMFSEIFMISALTGDGVEDLAKHLSATMPPGPWHYPEDQISDQPLRTLAAEVTREKLFLNLHQELPYSLTVETEQWEEFDDGSVRIQQVIFVAREQHKGICLGKGGARIKAVRAAAQKELEAFLGQTVHLFLFVKVRGKWQDDREHYETWGLDYNA